MTDLARQLNAFAATLKAQRHSSQSQPKTVREPAAKYVPSSTPSALASFEPKTMREVAIEYVTAWLADLPLPLFTEEELEWLQAIPNT